MSHQKSLLGFLNKFIPLSLDEYNELILPGTIKRHFDKKSVITTTGEVENYINFIDSGLMRKYYKKANEEVNTQISYEGHIIHSQESFHSRTPSEYSIETIEPTELTSITYECLEKIYSSSEKMQRLGRLVTIVAVITSLPSLCIFSDDEYIFSRHS
jgi:CRP-like cAMP-binding protein